MTHPEFINSATVTVPERLVLKGGSMTPVTLGVRYGLWIHPKHGPILIDTGYGPEVTQASGRSVPMRIYAAAIRPKLIAENDPVAVLAARGFKPEDVRHILISHFHADHISRLKAFPNARLHASGEGFRELKTQSPLARWRHGHFFELLPADFNDRLQTFEAATALDLPAKLRLGFDIFGDGSVFALSLPGHAQGHFGFYWPQGSNARGLVYGADASWLTDAILKDRPPQGPARLVYDNEALMAQSLERLRNAAASGFELKVCHDPV